MARAEWLRTFLVVYRSGSVTEGARQRGLSQPAASQQIAGLERALGSPLFLRTPGGMVPTHAGSHLYLEVAESLDRLERVLLGLDAGALVDPDPAVRVGSTAEFFSLVVLPRIAGAGIRVSVRFGSDAELFDWLNRGELDVVVAASTPTNRTVSVLPLGAEPFVLVGAPDLVVRAPRNNLRALGAWMVGKPWVAVSFELPLTRRLWQQVFGQPFSGNLRLVAPDRRAVAASVVAGMGLSLLPRYVCAVHLEQGVIAELIPVSHEVPPEGWFVCCRQADLERPGVAALLTAITG
jgi:DNA-binding transcriptional LysR family regulator